MARAPAKPAMTSQGQNRLPGALKHLSQAAITSGVASTRALAGLPLASSWMLSALNPYSTATIRLSQRSSLSMRMAAKAPRPPSTGTVSTKRL